MSEKIPTKSILYPEKTGEPIARKLKDLREKAYPIPDSPEDADTIELPEYEKVKTEVYALTAYVIEQVHDDAFKTLTADPNTLKIRDAIKYPVPEGEVGSFNLSKAREDFVYAEKVLGLAEQAYVSAFVDSLQKWSDRARKGEGESQYDHRVYGRLQDLLIETTLVNTRKVNPLHHVESFIIRGANTVGSVSFDILRSIPFAYFNKYGKVISKDEYQSIAKQAEALVIQLSSLHIHSFSRLMQFTRAGSSLNRSVYLEFPLEFFSLEDADGSPKLVFDQNALSQFEQYKKTRGGDDHDEVRLGCPARDARTESASGERNLSVVSSVYRFYGTIADALITPHLEAYTESLLEKATKPPKKYIVE